jgi:hypothetical protein
VIYSRQLIRKSKVRLKKLLNVPRQTQRSRLTSFIKISTVVGWRALVYGGVTPWLWVHIIEVNTD